MLHFFFSHASDKHLLDGRHDITRCYAGNVLIDRHISQVHQLQTLTLYLFNHHTQYLALFLLILWKEEDTRAVSSFLRHWNALKENEFMRNLKQYACSITSLVACLSTAMLHILQHFESVIHQFMALVAMNVYNHSNATCIVFVLRVVKSLFLLSAHD